MIEKIVWISDGCWCHNIFKSRKNYNWLFFFLLSPSFFLFVLMVDFETARMFLIHVQAYPQHLSCILVLKKKFLEEKIVVVWNFKYNLFSNNPAPDNSPLSYSTEALFSFLLLPSPFLYWFKSKQSHLIMYRGRDCKVFIEPMWKWFSCIISCNCDCNTETDQNRLASYFPSGWLWSYPNI